MHEIPPYLSRQIYAQRILAQHIHKDNVNQNTTNSFLKELIVSNLKRKELDFRHVAFLLGKIPKRNRDNNAYRMMRYIYARNLLQNNYTKEGVVSLLTILQKTRFWPINFRVEIWKLLAINYQKLQKPLMSELFAKKILRNSKNNADLQWANEFLKHKLYNDNLPKTMKENSRENAPESKPNKIP